MSNVNKDQLAEVGIGDVAPIITSAIPPETTGQTASMVIEAAVQSLTNITTEHEVAEFVNPTDYEDYWRNHFYGTLYYVSGLVWSDYHPAYRLGFDAYFSNHGRSFEEVEPALLRSWEAIKGKSHLLWPQAKPAVRDGWQFVQGAVSGTSGREIH